MLLGEDGRNRVGGVEEDGIQWWDVGRPVQPCDSARVPVYPQPAHAASWRSLAELGGETQGTGSSRGGSRNGCHVDMSWWWGFHVSYSIAI